MNILRAIAASAALATALALPAKAEDRPLDLVNKAVNAIGRAGLEQLKTFAISGDGRFWEPDESHVAGGHAEPITDLTFVVRRDLTRDAANIAWVRDYLELPWPRMNKYSEIVADGFGFALGNDGGPRTATMQVAGAERIMSGNRLAATSRELKRTSPLLLLDMAKDMAKNPAALSAHKDVTVDGKRYPAVRYQNGTTSFLVLFDRKSGLPARVRTMDFDPLHGDSAFDWVASDWRITKGGWKYPFKQRYEIKGMKLMEYSVREVEHNPALEASLFAVPETVRSAAPKAASANIPYLWVLRRQLIGSYYDVENLTHDPSRVTLQLVDRAPGVVQVQGTIHHTLFVEMDKYLVVFDAPYMDGYSKWAIEQAKKRFPGKPIKYLVMTHHHIDHAAGYRSFLAEGATLVVGKGTRKFWKKVLASKDSLSADGPKKDLSKAPIIEVGRHYRISDGSRSVELHDLPNMHSAGMLLGYIPDAKLGFQTDVWTGPGVDPLGAQAMPRQMALVNLVQREKLDIKQIIGGHGRVGAYSDILKTADGSVSAEESVTIINKTSSPVDFNVSPNGSYWIPFQLKPAGEAKIINGTVVNIITGKLRTNDRSEVTEKIEKGKRYEILHDPACNCRKLKLAM